MTTQRNAVARGDDADQQLVATWKPLTAGFVGAILLMIGSLGIGWLGSSSVLWQSPILIWFRTEQSGVLLAICCLAVGGLLLFRSWLRLGQYAKTWPPASGRLVRWVIVLWGLPMMLAIPLSSRDVYAYIARGRLVQAGVDPYLNGISSVPNWLGLGTDRFWAEAPTPYGPVFLWIEQAVVAVSGGSPELAILLFRVVSALGILLCAFYVVRLAELHGVNPNRALWLAVANPLMLINFIAAGHNDGLMIGLALAGLYYAATKRGVLGIVLISLSIAVKPITVILLPFAGLLWAGKQTSWLRKLSFWFFTAMISLALLTLMGWLNGFGFGWIKGLSAPGSASIWYAPMGAFCYLVMAVVSSLGGDGWAATHLFWDAAKVLAVLLAIWLMFRGNYQHIVRRLALAFAGIVFLLPMVQSWYVAWLIPLFAVTGIRDGWQTKLLYFVLAFFAVYLVSDQLSIYPYLGQNGGWLSIGNALIPAGLIGAVAAIYIMLIDLKARGLFLPRFRSKELR